jgi:hypothetical protein
MKYFKFIRIILIFIPIVILGTLVYKDFVPTGYLKVGYDFCSADPFISKFSPNGRVLGIENCTQAMVIDPVYFDVRLPQSFDEARIKLWYQKDSDTKLQIGPAENLDAWQWQLRDIEYMGSKGDWMIGNAIYDLSTTQYDSNDLRFLISSPGLDASGSEIVFDRIEIEFSSEPLTRDNFTRMLKDWIKFSSIYLFIVK